MKKLAAAFFLFRPINFLISFLVIATGYSISVVGDSSVFIMVCAALSGAFTLAAGNIVNDIFDIEIDKINHPSRPLASGIISYNTAKFIWFIFTLLSFILSSLINLYSFVIVLIIHVLLIIYSYKIKSSILTGNILIAFLTASAFTYGAFAAGNLRNIMIPALFAFILNFMREIVKDIQDIRGDRTAGVITYPLRYGIESAKKIIIIFIILLLILTLYVFFSDYYNMEFFILMMVLVNPLMIYIIKSFNTEKTVNYNKVSGILKFSMVIGLIAIYFGK